MQQEVGRCRAQEEQVGSLKAEADHLRGIISQL